MIRLEVKNYHTTLTEKLQKHQHTHQIRLINMNIVKVKKYYLLMKLEDKQAKITFSSLGKAFGT